VADPCFRCQLAPYTSAARSRARSRPLISPAMFKGSCFVVCWRRLRRRRRTSILDEDRDRLGGSRCERKQRRGRFLIHGQHALQNHRLIDDAAVPKMADRDDQTRVTVAIAKFELACFRPSAAVLSFGMCPEPAPIPLDNLLQRVRHRDGALPQSVWPALLLPATNSDPENRDSGIYNR
jgi:hypothetical protein